MNGSAQLLVGVTVAAIGATGCGSSQDLPESWGGKMEERDGVIWVTNPPEPLWPDDGEPRIEFELEQVFGADEVPEEAMLAAIRDVAVDGLGRVYILDQKDNRLVAFAPSGEFLWADGREGEGPGEIHYARGLVWNGTDLLYVANQSGTRVDTWSTAGKYLDTLRLADVGLDNASTLGFVEPSTLVLLSFPAAQTTAHTLIAGKEWELGTSFTMAASRDVEQPAGAHVGGDSRITDNRIVFGSAFDYEFRIFHVGGQPDRIVVRPGTGFVPAAIDLERGSVGSLGDAGAPLRLVGGNWLVQASWPTNVSDPLVYLRRAIAGQSTRLERHYALDLFDAEGRWLTGRVWDHPDTPGFGSLRLVGRDGKLYTTAADPFPQVRRYRVVLHPPS